jgi:hypothetical protein
MIGSGCWMANGAEVLALKAPTSVKKRTRLSKTGNTRRPNRGGGLARSGAVVKLVDQNGPLRG